MISEISSIWTINVGLGVTPKSITGKWFHVTFNMKNLVSWKNRWYTNASFTLLWTNILWWSYNIFRLFSLHCVDLLLEKLHWPVVSLVSFSLHTKISFILIIRKVCLFAWVIIIIFSRTGYPNRSPIPTSYQGGGSYIPANTGGGSSGGYQGGNSAGYSGNSGGYSSGTPSYGTPGSGTSGSGLAGQLVTPDLLNRIRSILENVGNTGTSSYGAPGGWFHSLI